MTYDANDPRITAYVLGELDEEASREFEEALKQDESLRQAVDDISETTDRLRAEFAAEPVMGLSWKQRQAIEQGRGAGAHVTVVHSVRWWTGAGLAAAACVALALVVPMLLPSDTSPDDLVVFADEAKEGRGATLGVPLEPTVGQSTASIASSAEELAEYALGKGEKAAASKRGRDADQERVSRQLDPSVGRSLSEDDLSFVNGLSDRSAGRVSVLDDAETGLSASGFTVSPTPGSPVRAGRRAPGGGLGGGGRLDTLDAPATSGGIGIAPPAELREPLELGDATGPEDIRYAREAVTSPAELAERERQVVDLIRRAEAEGEAARDQLVQLHMIQDELRDLRNEWNREQYERITDNPFLRPGESPLSTFSIDVDTASYSNVRRFITQQGMRPPMDAVRIEEMINYFDYAYAPPSQADEHPFAVHVEVNQAPWAPEHRLVKIGLKGREVDPDMRPATSLVFLLDVSGSMNEPNKLPLVKQSMKMLVDRLTPDDRIAIAVYAGASGLVLDSTFCSEKEQIHAAIDNLHAGGSTNGGAGIELAYNVASGHFIEQGVNRVILCTDGDFNVGVSSDADLVRLIEEKRDTGVFLSVLGFGRGNWQDAKMEKLSNAGNGNFAYIDTLDEAEHVLVDRMAGTLVTIAKDVKIQVEFNPAQVGAYRLIGYENRTLAAQDFNDDTKDAGEIGAGHTVTALYEIIPAGDAGEAADEIVAGLPGVDELKYQKAVEREIVPSEELLTVKLRYKQPDGDVSTKLEEPVIDDGALLSDASADFRFAAAVAGYGMILRDSPYKGGATLEAMMDLAGPALGEDERGRRGEFVGMVERTRAFMPAPRPVAEPGLERN